jgi:hypothetical protein
MFRARKKIPSVTRRCCRRRTVDRLHTFVRTFNQKVVFFRTFYRLKYIKKGSNMQNLSKKKKKMFHQRRPQARAKVEEIKKNLTS